MIPGEHMDRCPHCARPFGGKRYDIPFGSLACRIIDTVKRAGPEGVDGEELYAEVYKDRPAARTALKAYINQINDKLKERGLAIHGQRGQGGRYRLMRRKAA